MHGARWQAEPVLRRENVLSEALRRESVFARVVTQAEQIEFRDAGGIDQSIDREVAILRAGEFVDEIAHRSNRANVVVGGNSERMAQLVEQALLFAVPQNIPDAVAGPIARWRREIAASLEGAVKWLAHEYGFARS